MSFLAGLLAGVALTLWMRRRGGQNHPSVNEDGNLEFPMDTLAEMLAIPAERRERFLSELPSMFRRMWELADKYPLKTSPGTVWVDDNKGEFRPEIVNAPDGLDDLTAVRPLDLDHSTSNGASA